MSSTQTHSADSDAPKFHRLFRFYDPEVVAVMAILVGLFQVLQSVPAYTISTDIKYMFLFPLCLGSVSVIAGSFGVASEKTPRRDLLKCSLISGVAALVGALIGLALYIYAASTSPVLRPCSHEDHFCSEMLFEDLYTAVSWYLLLCNIAALVVHCLSSYSAFRGLRIQ